MSPVWSPIHLPTPTPNPAPNFLKYKAFWNFEYFSSPWIFIFPHVLWNAFLVFCVRLHVIFLNVLLSFLSLQQCQPFCTFSVCPLCSVFIAGEMLRCSSSFFWLASRDPRGHHWVQMSDRQDSGFRVIQIFAQILPLPPISCSTNHCQPRRPHR